MSHLARPLKYPPIFPLDKGLVLHFAMDDRSGVLCVDRSIKRNNGTINGASWIAGRRGSALSFDGTDDYVEVTKTSSLSPTSAITVTGWINNARNDVIEIIVTGDGVITDTYWSWTIFLRAVASSITARVTVAGTTYNLSTLIGTNTWRFFSLTFDGSTIKFYLDAGTPITQTAVGALGTSDYPIRIGAQASTRYQYLGVVDEVRIYNRALSAAEIKRIFESEIMLVRH